MLVFNLRKCFLGRAIKLEFHDVAELRSLEHEVNTSLACHIFSLNILTGKLAYYPDYVLIMILQILDEHVWSVGKERTETLNELLGIAGAEVKHKILQVEGRLAPLFRYVPRQKELGEADIHFLVREAERIFAKLRVVVLYGYF